MNNEIRREILRRRRAFAESEQYGEANIKIRQSILGWKVFRRAKTVMLYLPLKGEADVSGIYSKEKVFYIPVTRGVVIMPARYLPEKEMTKGEYGVSEPKSPILADKNEIDLVLVPAVAVDKNKNRMGFGKGCYDRFLENTSCVKAAVCFDFQLLDFLEAQPHDVKMDYIITESGYF